MEKVYFDKDFYDCWWVNTLDDIYLFKMVNMVTFEEENIPLSWSRNVNCVGSEDRVYDVEIDGEKYYFGLYSEIDRYRIESRDRVKLEKLFSETNEIFTGKTIN